MIVNDPIADMLTRIRNAQVAGHENVSIPASNMKKSIAKILLNEGFVKNVEYLNEGVQGSIRITLKYVEKRPVIGWASSASAVPACACTPSAARSPRFSAAWASPLFPRPRA